MNNAEIVGTCEGCAHLLDNVDAPGDRHRAVRELGRQRRANEVLHHQVKLALVRLADIVDIDDVRVVDAVRGLRLAKHPGAQMRLGTEVGTDQLDRDDAVDEHMAGTIDEPHASLAQSRLEAIATRDDLADQRVLRHLLLERGTTWSVCANGHREETDASRALGASERQCSRNAPMT